MDKNGYSIQYFEEKEIEHLAFTRSILSKEIELFEKIIDLQAKLFRGYAAVVAIHFYDLSSTDKIIFQSHVKSTYLLYTAHKLILQGNHGVALGLFRQIFEFQLICRYFHFINKEEEAEKWLDERQFNLNEKIWKRLKAPSKENLADFWRALCSQAHATTTSCQVISDIKENTTEIRADYYLLLMLLNIASYSLECLHKRQSLRSVKSLIGKDLYDEFMATRREWKEVIKDSSNFISNNGKLSESGKALLKDGKTKWVFKS